MNDKISSRIKLAGRENSNYIFLDNLGINSKQLTAIITELLNLPDIQNLYLNSNELTTLPPEIGYLKNLQSLSLYNNQLTTLPPEIGILKNLKSLSLNSNELIIFPFEMGYLKNLQSLSLYNNQLATLPPEIGNLENLQSLSLYNNQLTTLPPEIGNLENLQSLSLHSNRLTTLPPEIGNLENLQSLSLHSNRLTTLPPGIGNLKFLESLPLYSNRLTTLPPEIGNLENLQSLKLYSNKLTALLPEIGNLYNLIQLYLHDNQLTTLPSEIKKLNKLECITLQYNKLQSIPFELLKLPLLNELELYHNQIKQIPVEILNYKNIYICWEKSTIKLRRNTIYCFIGNNPLQSPPVEIALAGDFYIKQYLKQLAQTRTTIKLYEAKLILILIGDGNVGKTCLMKKIFNPAQEINKNEYTTKGISINQWKILMRKEGFFTVNFWDFGGQEIYHATHQFFLTKRSLYLMVWTAREDDDITRFDYWLNIIKLLSDNSPVIIVLNKIDERIKTIDEKGLLEKFPNILEFHQVSALDGRGIQKLIARIKHHISKLEHIGDVLPGVWVEMKNFFIQHRQTFNYVLYKDYIYLCSKYKLNKEQAKFLSRYFHDLGFFLHFHDNPILQDIVFLKPDWATRAVYKVIDTPEIVINKGVFQFEQLKGIWNDYPPDKFIHLLELMKMFELCFQLPGTQTYIVPELLPDERSEFKWIYTHNLNFEYHYAFMPSGIVTRFIVRTHDLNTRRIYWKNGAVLVYENTMAWITQEALNRKIKIRLCGNNKKDLLAIIRREIDYIHNTLNNPDVKEMIPCACSVCTDERVPFFHEYIRLKNFLEKGIKTAQFGNTGEQVSISLMLGEVELDIHCSELTINNEIKQFMVGHFSSTNDFDSLCRELGVRAAVYAGDFDDRVTGLIQYIEIRKPNPSDALKKALLKLRPRLKGKIANLFTYES